jgi:dihydropteroate synthase
MDYIRPILQVDAARPSGALTLGWCWFTHVELLQRNAAAQVVPVAEVAPDTLAMLTAPRSFAGMALDRPHVMGILNVTPDSFSDGGRFNTVEAALAQAHAMAGADILDIGGESTRPGAVLVDLDDEITRTAPVIAAIRAAGITTPISLDTRKSAVVLANLRQTGGADIVNDVSAMTYDVDMASVVACAQCPVILMHAQGTPQTMQTDPRYDDVLLDVYDFLAARIAVAANAGIARDCIAVDPGIGFGKTITHNLALLQRISLFHSLGCPILLGASRKKFIGTIGGEPRLAGSLAVALAGVAQGVQMLRVHDVDETVAALSVWQAVRQGAQT